MVYKINLFTIKDWEEKEMKGLICSMLLIAATISGFAQNQAKPEVYSGHIAGSNGEAVEYATYL